MCDNHQTPSVPDPIPSAPPVAPPPMYYPPVGYPAPYASPSRTNGLAVASLVLGILSVLFGGALFAVPAIVMGICSRRGDEPMSRMAVAGIVCGVVGLVFGILSAILLYKKMLQMSMMYME